MITREEVLHKALMVRVNAIKHYLDWHKDRLNREDYQLECEELELAKALLRGLENGSFKLVEVEEYVD